MSALPRTTRLTLDEFLAWEEQQPERHEFVDGEIFAMTGATLNHNLIVHNLIVALGAQLRGRKCFVFHEGAKVLIGEDSVYPDIVVTCAPQQPTRQFVQHPSLVMEVLSPSTESYDRGKKWTLYQRLPSLRTYVLVSQDEIQVDVFRRTGDGWHFTRHTDLGAVIELADPPCRLALADLYADLIEPTPSA